jgi:hypothetical protein
MTAEEGRATELRSLPLFTELPRKNLSRKLCCQDLPISETYKGLRGYKPPAITKVLGRLLSTFVLPESVFVEILSLLFLLPSSLHPRRLGSAVTIPPFHIWAEQIQRDG